MTTKSPLFYILLAAGTLYMAKPESVLMGIFALLFACAAGGAAVERKFTNKEDR